MWIAIRNFLLERLRSLYLDFFPIILQQIASCSYDGILLGAVFVYMAYAISLLYSEEKSIEEFGVMFFGRGDFVQ